jgi:large subunit ribosomal protein L13
MRARRPDFIIKRAVKGILPKNNLADKMLTKLRVFAVAEHSHTAQNPETIKL